MDVGDSQSLNRLHQNAMRWVESHPLTSVNTCNYLTRGVIPGSSGSSAEASVIRTEGTYSSTNSENLAGAVYTAKQRPTAMCTQPPPRAHSRLPMVTWESLFDNALLPRLGTVTLLSRQMHGLGRGLNIEDPSRSPIYQCR